MIRDRVFAGRNILLVEDEWFIVDDMVRAFERQGARIVGPAPSVQQALDLVAETERLDGAVLDINLHGDDVYDVADALARRGVPFVFATGYDKRHIPARYNHIVRCEKPVEAANVAETLYRLI